MLETLQFGAYSDAVPPFYVAYKPQEPPDSAYVPHTEFRGNLPVKIQESTALKLLWQVKSLDLKIEYTLENSSSEGWETICDPPLQREVSIESMQIDGLGNIANGWQGRPLKIPQGTINYQNPPYGNDADANRALMREGFGPINPFNPGDLADWEVEKNLADAALNAEKQAISQKLAEIKALANAYEYFTLEAEIERQEASFNLAATAIINKFQTDLQDIISEFNDLDPPPPSWSTTAKSSYARRIQTLRDRALFNLRQEKQLEWFEWEGGFDKKINFQEVGKMRIMGNKALHRPPTIAGIFTGLTAATESSPSFIKRCIGIINLSEAFFSDFFDISFIKPISYQRKEFFEGEDETPRTVTREDEFGIGCNLDILRCVSTVEETAAKIYIKPSRIDADLFSGVYVAFGGAQVLQQAIPYGALYNQINETVMEGIPFTEDPSYSPQQKEVVYSGEFFGSGSFAAAKEYMAPVAAKVQELKNPGPTKECGFLRIKEKSGTNLIEQKLYCRSVLPLKNVFITYQIQSYHTDTQTEPAP